MSNRSHSDISTRSRRKKAVVAKDYMPGIARGEFVYWLAWTGAVASFALFVIALYGFMIARLPAGTVVGKPVDRDWLFWATCMFFILIGAWNAIRFSNQTGLTIFRFKRLIHQKGVVTENNAATSDENEYFMRLSATYGLPRFSVPNLKQAQGR